MDTQAEPSNPESEIELSGDDDPDPVLNRIRPTQTGNFIQKIFFLILYGMNQIGQNFNAIPNIFE